MTIPESFDSSSGKPKKMNATKKHWGRQRLLLIHCKDRKSWPQEDSSNTILNISYDIFYVEYAWIYAKDRSIK